MTTLPLPQTKLVPFAVYREAYGRLPPRPRTPAPAPQAPGLLPYDDLLALEDERPLSDQDRDRVIDAAQDVLCAALASEGGLCALRRDRVHGLCLHRPQAALVALREIERNLALDLINRHLMACHKRRQILRELQSLVETLRDIAG